VNTNGPEQDRDYWVGWSLVVCIIAIAVIIGIIVS
jgi:Mg2+ and Co2+ transporter CorA